MDGISVSTFIFVDKYTRVWVTTLSFPPLSLSLQTSFHIGIQLERMDFEFWKVHTSQKVLMVFKVLLLIQTLLRLKSHSNLLSNNLNSNRFLSSKLLL